MSRRGTTAVATVAVAVLAALVPAASAVAASPSGADATGGPVGGTAAETEDGATSWDIAYPGDPQLEAALVAEEDRRLLEIGTVASLARWSDLRLNDPYRMATGSNYTLVLTERGEPYTVEDLLALSPQTFVREPDGAYLLSENIVVSAGATLNLTAVGALTLRMASDQNGFVSIVNDGGRLEITGSEAHPVVVTSWDRDAGEPDRLTDDGRAYVRSTGGQSALSYADFRDLGFWSGRTGGLALTGTDRPNTGALDRLGQALAEDPAAMALAQQPEVPGAAAAAAAARGALGEERRDQVLPAGELPIPEIDADDPQYSFVSASMNEVTTRGNAFGLFLASANGVDITDSSFADSLVDGIVMHRYVTNAVMEGTSATGNAGDGVVLSRATTGIVLSEIDASANGRNGISMSGLPLADGPNATGVPVGSYGNNSVSNGTMQDNGRYGIEVVGGQNIGVQANDVSGGDMGIVVRDGAEQVSIVGNAVTGVARQGIAIRDGVSDGTVSGNIVTGGETSLYVRGSDAQIQRNTLSDAAVHAVSLVGDVAGLTLQDNTFSGRGPSAVDAQRAPDVALGDFDNESGGWEDTTPWVVTLKRFLQPLTLMWTLLGLLVLGTAVRGWRRPRFFAHPYADKAPVSQRDPSSAYPSGSDSHKDDMAQRSWSATATSGSVDVR